jgi:hypothetical protein
MWLLQGGAPEHTIEAAVKNTPNFCEAPVFEKTKFDQGLDPAPGILIEKSWLSVGVFSGKNQ